MKTIFVPLSITLLLSTAILGQDESVTFSGEHRVLLSIPAASQHFDFDGEMKEPRAETDLELQVDRSDITLHAGLRVKSHLMLSGSQQQRFTWFPLENSVTLQKGLFSGTLGYQYFSWGVADKLNPTDNINPRDYTTGPNAEKLAIFSASMRLYLTERLSLQAVYVPFEEPDLFPVGVSEKLASESPFRRVRLSSLNLVSGSPVPEIESVMSTGEVRIDDPDLDPSSFLAGGRVKFSGGTFDVSASYLYDMDQYFTPEIELEPYSPLDATTKIDPSIPSGALSAVPSEFWSLKNLTLRRGRIHRMGLDAKTVIDRFGVWFEGCYSLTEDTDNSSWQVRNSSFDWTLGLDFSYGSSDEHYLNIQQIGRYIVDYDDRFSDDYQGGTPGLAQLSSRDAMEKYYYRLFSNRLAYVTEALLCGAALRSEWSLFDGNLTPSIEAVYLYPFGYDDTEGKRIGDIIGTAELSWKPADAVEMDLGFSGYYAAFSSKNNEIRNIYDNKIGLFFPQSRIYLNAVFNWAR
ncbi:MAG: hypothetical protein GX556_08430 [Fibrobacter sp.]|nr:hypothetical protein [Fibrobacter sp.]